MTREEVSVHRVIRTFISSTFDDMEKERDELVKQVFPSIRQLCESRYLTFTEVDLRWGITSRDQAEGNVLPLCLAEIDRCRPFFIGMIGSRYGSVVEDIHADLLLSYPWLQDYRGRSITEIEIAYGALRDPPPFGAFLYCRRESESAAPTGKLAALRRRLDESPIPVRQYADAAELGELVLRDLTQLIEARFPSKDTPGPLERDSERHRFFAESQSSRYIERAQDVERLDIHARSRTSPLMVTGPLGGGKTALLAHWATRMQSRFPQLCLIEHYVGNIPGSDSYPGVLRRILFNLKQRFGLDVNVPESAPDLVHALPRILAHLPKGEKVAIVLDGLGQIEDRDNAPDLTWLPSDFPPNVRVFCSATEGRALAAARRRGWQVYSLGLLSEAQKSAFVDRFLAGYGKKLEASQLNSIRDSEQTANPLFLGTLLAELRVYGDFKTLDEHLRFYLHSADTVQLFRRILRRLENDYAGERSNLVRDAASYLWAARRGLTEEEIRHLLGARSRPLPGRLLAPLLLAIRDHLADHSGLLGFAHEYLRQAVALEYLESAERKKEIHCELAAFFEEMNLGSRQLDEYPWQLDQAGETDRLARWLARIPVFLAFPSQDGQFKFELQAYWKKLAGSHDVVAEYFRSLRDEVEKEGEATDLLGLLNQMALFFRLANRLDGARQASDAALELAEKTYTSGSPKTAVFLNNAAELNLKSGDLHRAKVQFLRALELTIAGYGERDPLAASILDNLGQVEEEPAKSEAYYRRALSLRHDILGPADRATLRTMNNLSAALIARGNVLEAEDLLRKTLALRDQYFGPLDYDTLSTTGLLGYCLMQKGRLGEALDEARRALDGFTLVLGREHRLTLLQINLLVVVLIRIGELEEAESFALEYLDRLTPIRGPEHIDAVTGLHNLGVLRLRQGRVGEALKLISQATIGATRSVGERNPQTLIFRNSLAEALYACGRIEEAEATFRNTLELKREVQGQRHLEVARTLHALAQLYKSQGRISEASACAREALSIRVERTGVSGPLSVESEELLTSLSASEFGAA